MKNQMFTPDQLETIKLKVIALLSYVKKHDGMELPHCFRFCEKIVRNIDISRDAHYAESNELTALIKDDWRIAFRSRDGLLEYYIQNDEFEVQRNMNAVISKQISEIDEYINTQ